MKKRDRKQQNKARYFDNSQERYIWFTSLFLVLAIVLLNIANDTLWRTHRNKSSGVQNDVTAFTNLPNSSEKLIMRQT